MNEEVCDGSGYVEYADGQGYLHQRPCPGCGACLAGLDEPLGGPGSPQTIEIGPETLADLRKAYASLQGPPEAPDAMAVEKAWGLLLSYLPVLLEIARLWMVEKDAEPTPITITAHRLYDRGN